MLMVGLDGVKRNLTPPPPVEEDVYNFDDSKLRELNIETLPGTLEEAIEELEKDDVLRETLGEHTFQAFIRAKRAEWDSYRIYVTNWELDRYLQVF
jgi:glutamine synthetase